MTKGEYCLTSLCQKTCKGIGKQGEKEGFFFIFIFEFFFEEGEEEFFLGVFFFFFFEGLEGGFFFLYKKNIKKREWFVCAFFGQKTGQN